MIWEKLWYHYIIKIHGNNELQEESRLIDVKDLITEPYVVLINLLIGEPKGSNLISAIPNGTKINSTQLKNDILYLDLSKEFIENHIGGEEEEKISIYAIVNTLTQLTEVNSVKILIDGNEDSSFSDGKINFKEPFVKTT